MKRNQCRLISASENKLGFLVISVLDISLDRSSESIRTQCKRYYLKNCSFALLITIQQKLKSSLILIERKRVLKCMIKTECCIHFISFIIIFEIRCIYYNSTACKSLDISSLSLLFTLLYYFFLENLNLNFEINELILKSIIDAFFIFTLFLLMSSR